MGTDRNSILIVNPNIGSRAILREALKSFLYKSRIVQAPSLKEAIDVIKRGNTVDVIFVSFDLGQPQITEFITELKSEPSMTQPPIVATIKKRDGDSSSEVASLYLEGVAGFISEPYSSDDISRLWNTILDAKRNTESQRKVSKATYLLLSEAVKYLDINSQAQAKQNNKNAYALRDLKKIASKLSDLYNQDKDQYSEALLRVFENIKPPKTSESNRKTKVVAKAQVHPGKLIAELMEKRKLTVEGLKSSLRIEPEQFQQILNCQLAIDEHTSREISRIFGKTSKEWLAMQEKYNAYIAQIEPEGEK